MDIIIIEELLQKSFQNKFKFHPEFSKEFIDLVSKSGEERKIINQLNRRMNAIIELGNKDYGLKWLEHLKKYVLIAY